MEIPKHKEHLGIFWCSLEMMGILSPGRSDGGKTCFFKNCRLMTVSAFIFFHASWCFLMTSKTSSYNELMISLPHMTSRTTVVLMFLSFARKRHDLDTLRRLFRKFSTETEMSVPYVFVYFILLIFVSKPLVYTAVFLRFSEESLEYYAADFFPSHDVARRLMSVLSMALYVSADVIAPTFLCCLIVGVCCQWTRVISGLETQIQCRGYAHFTDDSQVRARSALLQRCRFVWQGTRFIRRTFSSTLFFLVFIQLVNIFKMFAGLIRQWSNSNSSFLVPLNTFYLLAYAFAFTVMVYVASRIPEKMEETVQSLKELNYDLTCKSYGGRAAAVEDATLQLLINEKPVALSIGGCLEMNMNIILGTFGSLVTYGMLIIQNIK